MTTTPTIKTAMPAGTLGRMNQDDINRAIDTLYRSFEQVDAPRVDAKRKMIAARDSGETALEGLMVQAAKLAHDHDWDASSIKNAAKGMADRYAKKNETATAREKRKESIDAFKTRIMLAIHEQVRGHVADYFALARRVWNTEAEYLKTEGADKTRAPVHEAFPRFILVALAMMRARKDKERANQHFTAEAHVADFARETIKRRKSDPKLVYAKFVSILDALKDFASDTPNELINACVEALGKVKETDLKLAYSKANGLPYAAPASAPEPEEAEEAEEAEDTEDTEAMLDALNNFAAPVERAAA